MLTSNPETISSSILQEALKVSPTLFPFPEEWFSLFSSKIQLASFKEEDSDYLYSKNKIATYPGRHLDGQRGHVKYLTNHHTLSHLKIIDCLEDAKILLHIWQEQTGLEKEQTDYFSCLEALKIFSQLPLSGFVVYADQEPAAFAIGEWISTDCYTIHFAKGKQEIKGIYSYLFQTVALHLEKENVFLNFEQDLGISALRHSKLSYLPDILKKKWRVQL